jgi:hypothetical protein
MPPARTIEDDEEAQADSIDHSAAAFTRRVEYPDREKAHVVPHIEQHRIA